MTQHEKAAQHLCLAHRIEEADRFASQHLQPTLTQAERIMFEAAYRAGWNDKDHWMQALTRSAMGNQNTKAKLS